jgi:hypothetical protein
MGTAVAKSESTAVKHRYTLDELVIQINGHMYDANNAIARANRLRLKVGMKLLELRERVEAGEAGEISWWDWFEQRRVDGPFLLRSRKDAERLMRIARAEDPESALEEDNAKARERMRKQRDGANKADVRSKTEPDADEPVEEPDTDEEMDERIARAQARQKNRKFEAQHGPMFPSKADEGSWQRLAKVMALLNSDQEGERQSAANAANKILEPMGWRLVKAVARVYVRSAPVKPTVTRVYVETLPDEGAGDIPACLDRRRH